MASVSLAACLSEESGGSAGGKVLISSATPLWFPDPFVDIPNPDTEVAGAYSYLMRAEADPADPDDHDIIMGFMHAPDLDQGHVMTMWYATFSAPQLCEVPRLCSRYDFPNPHASASFYYALEGDTVDGSGEADLTGSALVERDQDNLRVGIGMQNVMVDEIHLLPRDHGPPVAGLEEEQRTTYWGGCLRSGDPLATFECFSPQYARHTPESAHEGTSTSSPCYAAWPDSTAVPAIETSRSRLARSSVLDLAMGYLDTDGLTPGDAISVSWYVFNAPENCALGAGSCTAEDVANPEVDASVIDSRGGVVDDAGHLKASLGPIRAGDPMSLREGSGNLDVDTAEFVIALRSHGVAIPELVHAQTTTFDGACDVNACADVQFIRH